MVTSFRKKVGYVIHLHIHFYFSGLVRENGYNRSVFYILDLGVIIYAI